MSAWLGSGHPKDGHHQFSRMPPSELRTPTYARRVKNNGYNEGGYKPWV